jgi:hypothetical protein
MTNIRKHDIYANLVDGVKRGSCPQAPVPIMEEYSEHYHISASENRSIND